MKHLDKIQINTDKLMKNEELLTLRGGDYHVGWQTCHGGAGVCSFQVAWCGTPEEQRAACDVLCTGWDYIICAEI